MEFVVAQWLVRPTRSKVRALAGASTAETLNSHSASLHPGVLM